MITIKTNQCKTFSQNNYDNLINDLSFHQFECTCGSKGQLTKHAYYKRSIKDCGDLVELRILRVKCMACDKTHAILPDTIVPYSRISMKDHLRILVSYMNNLSFEQIMIDNILINENNIYYIIKSFIKHWNERLKSAEILFDNFLILNCFKYFERQFMQIKCTPNILFTPTHTT
jgi:transposase